MRSVNVPPQMFGLHPGTSELGFSIALLEVRHLRLPWRIGRDKRDLVVWSAEHGRDKGLVGQAITGPKQGRVDSEITGTFPHWPTWPTQHKVVSLHKT